jgi:hypothetical protein
MKKAGSHHPLGEPASFGPVIGRLAPGRHVLRSELPVVKWRKRVPLLVIMTPTPAHPCAGKQAIKLGPIQPRVLERYLFFRCFSRKGETSTDHRLTNPFVWLLSILNVSAGNRGELRLVGRALRSSRIRWRTLGSRKCSDVARGSDWPRDHQNSSCEQRT